MVEPKNNKMLQIAMITIIIGLSFIVAPRLAFAQNPIEHEYAKITRDRVTAAMAASGGKEEIILAEGSLTALGWFVLYGNDSKSAELAVTMSEIVTDEYKGTDKMNVIYLDHTSTAYEEMVNLSRFEKRKPDNPSDEYSKIVQSRVEKALANGAGYAEFRSAEGSLAALGWMTLFGNDANSKNLATQLMNKAFNEWRGANEVYMLQSVAAYGEMLNLGGFKLNASSVAPATSNNTVEEQFWDSIKNSNDSSNFQSYLNNFPNGKYATLASLKMNQISGSIIQTPNPPTNPNPVSPTGSTSSVEEQYWDAVKNSLRVQDYQSYLSSYPNGKFASLANLKISQLGGSTTTPNSLNPGTANPKNQTPGTASIEEQYWDVIKNSTRAQDYESYLKDYPNGQFTPIARLKLQQIQGSGTPTKPTSNTEDQSWNSIKNSSRAQDFQSYLNTFPNGKYAGIARLRINQLSSPGNPGTVKPNLPATGIPAGTNNQSRGEAILSKAQIGSMNEMLGLRKYWIITEPGDLDSKTFIAEELRNEFPQLTAALAEEDAEFFIMFAMIDQATGVKIIGNVGSPNQTQLGQLLVFRSLPTNSTLPNIRILFNVSKTRVFNNTNGTFSRHPATNGTRDFVKELKKIKF